MSSDPDPGDGATARPGPWRVPMPQGLTQQNRALARILVDTLPEATVTQRVQIVKQLQSIFATAKAGGDTSLTALLGGGADESGTPES